jgi:hypothetical protein
MKPFLLRKAVYGYLTVSMLALFSLVSCDGGGGDPGVGNATLPAPNSIPATQLPSVEISNAFAATLSGAQEVPARQSAALGAGSVLVNPITRQMLAVMVTTGIAGTAAHIHQSPPGISGPIIFPLTETTLGSGVWTTRAVLTDGQITAFRAGDYYFNVHSLAFADGEIRGQITAQAGVASPSVTSSSTFLAALRGLQEVPANTSVAQGTAALIINPVSRQLVIGVNTVDIAGTAAHIHEGVLGVNGPILIPLNQTPFSSGTWAANSTLTEAQYVGLIAGNMYVNVHTAALPAGEIRGQLFAQQQSGAAAVGVTGTANGTTAPPATTTTPMDTGMTPATPLAPMAPGVPLAGY